MKATSVAASQAKKNGAQKPGTSQKSRRKAKSPAVFEVLVTPLWSAAAGQVQGQEADAAKAHRLRLLAAAEAREPLPPDAGLAWRGVVSGGLPTPGRGRR
jgi:hypothetical protein